MAIINVLERKQASANRESRIAREAAIEKTLDTYFSSPTGLMKIADSLSLIVRRQLDYKGITRNFSVVELLPQGMPAFFDRDVQFLGAPAVGNCAVGKNGAVREVYMGSKRINLGDGFEIGIVPQIPWSETVLRRYDVVKRTGERLREGLQQREDLLWLSYLDTAAKLYTDQLVRKHPAGNVNLIRTGKVTKGDLADAFAQIDDRRLVTRFVLGDAYLRASIQNWTFQEMDQAGMQELRETGYLGDMWGASFFFNDQLGVASGAAANKGVAYVLTEPQMLSWTPIRMDAQVTPADKGWEFTMGFAGYEFLNMVIHNNWGIVKITYDKTVYTS